MDTRKQLVKAFSKAFRDPRTGEAFLIDLLTPRELADIEKRWQIICMLDDGVDQRTIAGHLGVGIATVTRGSRELQDARGGFKKVLALKK